VQHVGDVLVVELLLFGVGRRLGLGSCEVLLSLFHGLVRDLDSVLLGHLIKVDLEVLVTVLVPLLLLRLWLVL